MLKDLTKEDMPESVKDIVDIIGIDAFKELVRLLGGSNLYIPNEVGLVRDYRNKKIKNEFCGDYKSIAKKFGISEVQVRNIVKSR